MNAFLNCLIPSGDLLCQFNHGPIGLPSAFIISTVFTELWKYLHSFAFFFHFKSAEQICYQFSYVSKCSALNLVLQGVGWVGLVLIFGANYHQHLSVISFCLFASPILLINFIPRNHIISLVTTLAACSENRDSQCYTFQKTDLSSFKMLAILSVA